VHSMPRVSDTELANKIEAAKADLGRARDASPILSNSAAPAPEGGAVDIDAILEMAAKAVEDHQRVGREWVKGSSWDDLTREASGRIRALTSTARADAHAAAAASAAAAERVLDRAERAEDDALEGDEGCVWPGEALRVAYTDLSALATREEAPA